MSASTYVCVHVYVCAHEQVIEQAHTCSFFSVAVDDDDFIYKLANKIIGVSLAIQFIYFISLSIHVLPLFRLLCIILVLILCVAFGSTFSTENSEIKN